MPIQIWHSAYWDGNAPSLQFEARQGYTHFSVISVACSCASYLLALIRAVYRA